MPENALDHPMGKPKPQLLNEQSDILMVAAWLVVASITVATLYLGKSVIIPLVTAFLISFALNPLVTWLSRRGLPRVVSVIMVMLVLGTAVSGLGLLVASQVRSLSAELPNYQSTIRKKIHDVAESIRQPGLFDGVLRTVDTVQEEVKASTSASNEPAMQRVSVVPPARSPFATALEWILSALEPLATIGIVLIFVFLALLDRGDLRDRLIRLLGGNLHKSTDAMEEAGRRISRYLLMQLAVNISYGVPMAAGLWAIGVPGWLLWGTLAAFLRFIPYLGPLISAIFPIALAFAVGSGWEMVAWTVALIVFLELVSNNVVEPLLYGTSTGLSAMSLIASATFWTALWGPVGLILSTPLTVCLLVIGRSNPQLRFFDTLLGSTPVLDIPTRIYQRLLADDPNEAIEIVEEAIKDDAVVDFYSDYGIEVLRKVHEDYHSAARPEHRLRVANGMDVLLDDLREAYPGQVAPGEKPRVACIGGRWEIDSVACEMLVHSLSIEGIPAILRREGVATARYVADLDIADVDIICISYFSDDPASSIKSLCKRLRNRWLGKRIVLALWSAPEALLEAEAAKALGADEVFTTVREGVLRIHRMISPEEALERQVADAPENDAARVKALQATNVLDGHAREDLDALAKRAADVFDIKFAVISAIDADDEYIIGQSVDLPGTRTKSGTDMITMPRDEAICDHVVAAGETLVVNDTQRDPRFIDHPAIRLWDTNFYAGAPLKTADGMVLGALCLLDTEPHKLSEDELSLLESMAADVVSVITGTETPDQAATPKKDERSATVAQKVPK